MKTVKILILIFFLSLSAIAQQQSAVSPAFFRLTGLSGEFRLEGLYRKQTIKRSYLDDTDFSSFYSGGLLLNAHSFFWHPNFLQVDLGLEYSPEQSRDNYLIIPDQGEVRTLKKLDLRTVLFQKKIVSLSTFANVSQTYSNREFLSNVRTDSKNWGGVFFFRNNFLPLSISYQQGEIDQQEIETGRLFNYQNSNLQGRINKSFGKYSRNELIYTQTVFNRIEKEYPAVKNDLQDILLNNEIYFDRKQRYRFNSILNASDQKGYDKLKRMQAFETMTIKLPGHFDLIGNYNYYNVDRTLQTITQETSRGILRHKLFESLQSSVYYENTSSRQTEFSQTDTRTGIDLNYEKKIPTGQINLSYKYLLQHQDKKGESSSVQIMHEEYTLTDGLIVLFKRPFAEAASIIVRDATGGILYQLNLDYILIVRGDYLEIQRVPGGQISNNGIVYIDYVSLMPGNYTYDMSNQYWSAGISLFKQLINVYYRNIKQDYKNLKQTDFVTLNYFTQQVYGCRFEYKAMNFGVEYDDNNSSILPYQLTRYFFNVQGQLNSRVLVALNSNISNYYLVNEDLKQEFADVSGQLAYNLTPKSKLNFEAGYRKQSGQGIGLDLMNSKAEYSLVLKQMYLTFGVQAFQRNYMEEIDNYRGVFFRFARRF